MLLAWLACAKPDDHETAASPETASPSETETETETEPAVEPLDLPADPAAFGVPVGVMTVDVAGAAVEVWYPAPDAVGFAVEEVVDPNVFLPAAFLDHVGPVVLPTWSTPVLRDAEVRNTGTQLPIVLFSHGLAAMRVQSLDEMIHLASRGYAVVAMDHPGRMIGDALVCLFDPPLPECDATGLFVDPAPEDVAATLDWLEGAAEDGPLAGRLDLSRVALTGFSAGGNTTTSYGPSDDRIDALVAVAGGGAYPNDKPSLVLAGTCDAFGDADTLASIAANAAGTFVGVGDAGHLGFSDLCDLELIELADTWLEGRDDLSALYYPSLRALASDGCPGGVPEASDTCSGTFRPVDEVLEIQRYYTTAFLDDVFFGTGPGMGGGPYADVEVRSPEG